MVRASLAAVLLVSTAVFAQSTPDETVRFKHLELSAVDDWLVVDIQVGKASWRGVAAHPETQLIIHAAHEHGDVVTDVAWAIPLDAPTQHLTLPLARAMDLRQVDVWIESSVDMSIALDEVSGRELSVRLPRGSRQPALPPPRLARQAEPEPVSAVPVAPAAPVSPAPAVVPVFVQLEPVCVEVDVAALTHSCNDAYFSQESVLDCVRAGTGTCFDPVPVVQACAAAVTGDRYRVECMKAASGAQRSPAGLIDACGEALIGGADVVKCVDRFASQPPSWNVERVIDACEDAVVGGEALLSCVGAVVSSESDPRSRVTSCGENMIGNDAVLQCLQASR